jgi:hypothetical protein
LGHARAGFIVLNFAGNCYFQLRAEHLDILAASEERNMRRVTCRRLNLVCKASWLALLPCATVLYPDSAFAQTLTWDASGANPAAPTDASGNWNTTTDKNWSDGAVDLFWVNGDEAAIGNGGTAGTITINDLSGTVSASAINFNPVSSGSYTIAASSAETLTLTGSAKINLSGGAGATIGAPIAGSVGMNVAGATGTLVLTGNNTFTGTTQITSSLLVGTGGNLGASSNLVSLGTPNAGIGTDPVGTLSFASSVTNTIGSFKCASNNANANTMTINSATLNVTSNAALSGLNASTNAAFVVGSPNFTSAITTKLTIGGGGSLNVSGGSNNSSFLAGVGNTNSSANLMTATLDMSGLTNFSFVTGTGAVPATGGNEFALSHGAGAQSVATLAVNNTIVAGAITIGDNSNTPGLTGAGINTPSNLGTLNLGTGANVLRTNNLVIGTVRSQSRFQFAGASGTLLLTGAAGGSSTADITIGQFSFGTPPSTQSPADAGRSQCCRSGRHGHGRCDGRQQRWEPATPRAAASRSTPGSSTSSI